MAKKKKKINPQKKNPNVSAEEFKIINMTHLSEKSGISYNRIYNNLAGIYPEINFESNERNTMANVIHDELKRFFEVLGFEIRLKRMPNQEV